MGPDLAAATPPVPPIGTIRRPGRKASPANETAVDKQVDASSTRLVNALATNEELKSVKLNLRKGGTEEEDFFTITLEKARVIGSKLQSSASGGLYETVTFAYLKIQIDYHPQQGTGQRGAANSFSDELDVQT